MTVMMGIPVLGSNVLPAITGSVPVCGWATIRNVLKGKHRISGKKDLNRRRTFCATWIDKIYLSVLVVVVMMILPELASILEADFELEGFCKHLGPPKIPETWAAPWPPLTVYIAVPLNGSRKEL